MDKFFIDIVSDIDTPSAADTATQGAPKKQRKSRARIPKRDVRRLTRPTRRSTRRTWRK